MRPKYDQAKADAICEALRAWYAARGGLPPGPTLRELADAAGLPRSTVHDYLQGLIDQGRVNPVNGCERRWALAAEGQPRAQPGPAAGPSPGTPE